MFILTAETYIFCQATPYPHPQTLGCKPQQVLQASTAASLKLLCRPQTCLKASNLACSLEQETHILPNLPLPTSSNFGVQASTSSASLNCCKLQRGKLLNLACRPKLGLQAQLGLQAWSKNPCGAHRVEHEALSLLLLELSSPCSHWLSPSTSRDQRMQIVACLIPADLVNALCVVAGLRFKRSTSRQLDCRAAGSQAMTVRMVPMHLSQLVLVLTIVQQIRATFLHGLINGKWLVA